MGPDLTIELAAVDLRRAATVIEQLRSEARHAAGLTGPFCSGYAAVLHERAAALDALVTEDGR